MTTPPKHSEVLQRLSKDLKAAAAGMSVNEARYMEDAYYEVQDYRKAANNQFAALERSEEPNAVMDWLGSQHRTVESQIQRASRPGRITIASDDGRARSSASARSSRPAFGAH